MRDSADPMSIERLDNTSLTDRARTAILEAILDGRFSGRLPPEDVLAEMLNVSRTTIRTALQTLEEHGVITRKRAVGTTINAHVRPSALALQRLVGFDGLLREKGYKVKVEVSWTRGKPPVDVFPLDPDEDCLLTEKLFFAGKALAISIRDFVPWSNLRTQDIDDTLPPSLFEFSKKYWKTEVDHAIAEILAKTKDGESDTRLDIEECAAFTRLHETHYSSAGEPIAYSMIDVDNQFVTFEVFRRQ
jgi:GntR family transcriptional regulator